MTDNAPSLKNYRKYLSLILMIFIVVLLCISESIWTDTITGDMMFIAGLLFATVCSTGRLWCSAFISGYKRDVLITDGPYSMCRNPLYFFSFTGGIGIGLATESLMTTILIITVFSVYYPRVIRQEEERLLYLHGGLYREYMKSTPSFFPSPSLYREPDEYIIRPHPFRKRLLDSSVALWVLALIYLIHTLHRHGILPVVFRTL